MTATQPPPPVVLRSCTDLVAAVPYLLGFHPQDSLVVLALRDDAVLFAARGDLPGEIPAAAIAGRLLAVLVRERADAVALVGYGPAERVTPGVDAIRDALAGAGIHEIDAVRVDGGRYWSYVCDDPGCCSPDGVPYDPSSTPVVAAAVYAGQVALPDRQAVESLVAPVGGAAREAMRVATRRAEERLEELVASGLGGGARRGGVARGGGGPFASRRGFGEALRANARLDAELRAAGHDAVDDAFACYRQGGTLSDGAVAWLGILLLHIPIRDYAWEHTTDEEWHVTLWTDVVRRVEPEVVPAPASLLAFAAWRCGRGALAGVAVERALRSDPEYSMALLMEEVLDRCVAPSAWWADEQGEPLEERLDDRGRSGRRGRGGRPGKDERRRRERSGRRRRGTDEPG